MKNILLICFLSGCVINLEVPTAKTLLEKQISGEIKPTEDSILMRAVTRGESQSEILREISDLDLVNLEATWFNFSEKYLDSGYIGIHPGYGLKKMEKNFDHSDESYEALIVAGRLSLICGELTRRKLDFKLKNLQPSQIQKGWWVEENGEWQQNGVNQSR